MHNKPISAFMTKAAYQIGHDTSVVDAHHRMQELGVRHLPVMKGSQLAGIVSERDLATLVAISKDHPSTLQVVNAMTADPYVAQPSTPVGEVAHAMAEHKYGAVVVVEDGNVQGIFTTTDGMRVLAELLS